jgi:hypothetical protein
VCLTAAAAVASTGASIAGQLIGYGEAKKAAYDQQLFNAETTAQEERYRAEFMAYQNVEYRQNIDYKRSVNDFSKSEFDRQKGMIDKAVKGIEANRFGQYAAILQRQVEETIASAFNLDTIGKEGRKAAARARVEGAERGSGSSIEQVIADVSRQAGEAVTIMEMNRSGTMRQLALEAQGIKANMDQALYNIPVQVFGPSGPLTPPSPVRHAQPAAPVPQPSMAATLVNLTGSVVQGMSNYASWSGQSVKSAFKL